VKTAGRVGRRNDVASRTSARRSARLAIPLRQITI
jgi:hypothetical protein